MNSSDSKVICMEVFGWRGRSEDAARVHGGPLPRDCAQGGGEPTLLAPQGRLYRGGSADCRGQGDICAPAVQRKDPGALLQEPRPSAGLVLPPITPPSSCCNAAIRESVQPGGAEDGEEAHLRGQMDLLYGSARQRRPCAYREL